MDRDITMKFLKKGNLAKSVENELLLVDENNKGYKADQVIIAIWSMCDGNRTQEQIVDELASETKLEKTKVGGAVSDILEKLEQADLVQRV